MQNNYELKASKITKVVRENSATNTLFLELPDQKNFKFLAGQFMMVGLPGFGECPISISSNPADSSKSITITIRSVGELTRRLNRLKVGDSVLFRGPFGNGFPVVDKNLILIGGGCGFVPLRSVLLENQKRKDIKIQLFVGCNDEHDLLFQKELLSAKKVVDVNVICEIKTPQIWSNKSGFITELIKSAKLLENAKVFVCGPDVMYSHVVKALLKKGITPGDIYFTLEKRMHCGHGVCQHCAIGTKYVCKDGPVFSYEFLKNLPAYKYE